MNIYLSLFLTFLKIGAVSFGGGYGMLALIRETVVGNGWLTEAELLNFIAVSESTPGPIAINMATFIGTSQGGVLGAICATLGVILPSFVIILIIAALVRNFLKYRGVQAALRGIRPAVVALIVATGLILTLETLFGMRHLPAAVTPDWRGIGIFVGVALLSFGYHKWRKKRLSPILCILLSGAAGILLYYPWGA